MLSGLCRKGREQWGARIGEDRACKVRALPVSKHVTWKGALVSSGVLSTSVSQFSPGPSSFEGEERWSLGPNIWAQV